MTDKWKIKMDMDIERKNVLWERLFDSISYQFEKFLTSLSLEYYFSLSLHPLSQSDKEGAAFPIKDKILIATYVRLPVLIRMVVW